MNILPGNMSTEGRSWQFSHAVCRKPGKSIANGLRAGNSPDPDHAAFGKQHEAYVAVLREAGARVTVLDALEAYPDSVFVEDPALCLAGTAIILRPGAASRFGEAAAIAPDLAAILPRTVTLDAGPDGTNFADGGDILVSDHEVMVGLSARTNRGGVAALEPIVRDLGYQLRVVETPPGVLHFKTDCSLLDSETILSTSLLAASGCFDGYRVLEVPQGEEEAVNMIRFNDHVIMRTGFPKTAELLTQKGYSLKCIDTGEAAKVDGGISCMSLRFSV